MSENPEYDRRTAVDEKFREIETSINALKVEMAVNTIVTTQIRDILTSFRILASFSRWMTIMIAGVLAVYHGVEFWKK